jgi:hypothetical protein
MQTTEKYKRTFAKWYMLVSHQGAWQARQSLHYIITININIIIPLKRFVCLSPVAYLTATLCLCACICKHIKTQKIEAQTLRDTCTTCIHENSNIKREGEGGRGGGRERESQKERESNTLLAFRTAPTATAIPTIARMVNSRVIKA